MSELRTHRGHRVEVLEGNAQGVIDRGKEIEDLGEQMIGAADVPVSYTHLTLPTICSV